MTLSIQKSDFVLTPYMKSNDVIATFQIFNTLVPYFLLWAAAIWAAKTMFWLLPPIVFLMVLFTLRCFSLMHDCGHYSLFTSKKVNRCMGFILGIINAIPQYGWSRDHAYHHKTNGDWERYRGVADFLSTEEFSQLSPSEQKQYETLRHPLMSIPGGFFYLAIQPRLMLILGVKDAIENSEDKGIKAITEHKSKYWQSATEFWDLLFNNVCVIALWIICCHYLGAGLFLSIYSIVLTLAAMIFICGFFVQHIFEGTYAHKTADWDYLTGAILGSSYLKLPPILQWFVADIGYHNIHHLSERIPNYHLAACHQENSHLLSDVKVITMSDLSACAKFILWDADSDRLVSVAQYREMTQQVKVTA